MQKRTNDEGIPGIHQVTAITGDAQRNMGLYTEVLGLRMVKLPPGLESRRGEIQQALPCIELPHAAVP